MKARAVVSSLVLLVMPAVSLAQSAGGEPRAGATLLTAGFALQPYVFGDDAPRRNTGLGFSIGVRGWK